MNILPLLLLVAGACEPNEPAPTPTQQIARKALPRYGPVRIFVNNKSFGPAHGCDGPLTGEGTIVCGPSGSAMRVGWKFVESKPEGDLYEISCTLHQDETDLVDAVSGLSHAPATTGLSRTFAYVGEAVIVFENESQRILIYPGTYVARPTIADAMRRAPGV